MSYTYSIHDKLSVYGICGCIGNEDLRAVEIFSNGLCASVATTTRQLRGIQLPQIINQYEFTHKYKVY